MNSYDDIINLPRHISANHKQMPQSARAAQFAPFAALPGHSDAIDAAAKLADCDPEPYESAFHLAELLSRNVNFS